MVEDADADAHALKGADALKDADKGAGNSCNNHNITNIISPFSLKILKL